MTRERSVSDYGWQLLKIDEDLNHEVWERPAGGIVTCPLGHRLVMVNGHIIVARRIYGP